MATVHSTKTEEVFVEQLDTDSMEKATNGNEMSVSTSTPKQVRHLRRKQDLCIAAMLSGCYFFAYLDRGNIGNARIMGFQKDAHLSNHQFFNVLMMFFVGYMVFELPAALSLRYVHTGWAYGGALVAFGLFSACFAVADSYGASLALRLLIGAGESYVQIGLVFLSLYYIPKEMGIRNAIYFGLAPFAGMVSGVIAYACEKHLEGVLGKRAWQWLFIIEGVPTIAWGILVALIVPPLPEQLPTRGHWLFRNKEEHKLILERLSTAHNNAAAKPTWRQLWWAMKDPRSWLGAFAIIAPVLDIVVFGSFLPTFIHEFGFSPLKTQLYVMIPYAFATFFTPLAGILSDYLQQRAFVLLSCMVITITGLVILISTTAPTVSMVGCCFVAAGSYSGLTIAAAYIVVNHAGYTKRASALALAQILAQLSSIMSTQIYIKPPHYYMGHGIILGFNVLGFITTIVMYLMMRKANRERDEVARQSAASGRAVEGAEKSFEELCDKHPLFRYSL